MKKKVLLMGKSGSGKTSMRSIILLLSSLTLNLWDCGGQASFLSSYLSHQRDTVFRNVGVLIYVFDVTTGAGSAALKEELKWFGECLEGLREFSRGAGEDGKEESGAAAGAGAEAGAGQDNDGVKVFVLVNKMDLVPEGERRKVFDERRADILARAAEISIPGGWDVRAFATSIWDESLYKASLRPAWSHIVTLLLPSSPHLSSSLTRFAALCSATEIVLFERTTFLVIARSGTGDDEDTSFSGFSTDGQERDGGERKGGGGETEVGGEDGAGALKKHPQRFEKISELVKAFKLSCTKLSDQFNSLEIREPSFTAVLEPLTSNTYVLVVSADPRILPAAIQINIRLARPHFERVQQQGRGGPAAGEGLVEGAR